MGFLEAFTAAVELAKLVFQVKKDKELSDADKQKRVDAAIAAFKPLPPPDSA